jgi:hypothetical protein
LAGAADEQGHGSAVLPADVDFPVDDEDHLFGGSAFLEEDVPGIGPQFAAAAGEPEALVEREAVERADTFERGCDFFNRRGSGRRDDGGRRHQGPP